MAGSTNEIERSLRSLNRMIPKQPFDHVDEEKIAKIQVRLRDLESAEPPARETTATDRQRWSDSPRAYTLLRSLSCAHEEVVAVILKTKINDYSIPLSPSILKHLSIDIDEETLEGVQAAFLSSDSQMRAGALTGLQPDHRRLEQGKLFLEDVKALGRGSSAMVYSVRHRVSKKEFACKRIERGPARFQHDNLRDFLREVRILQRLHHQHIVRLIASYTDEATFSLILLPVANDTLESLLRQMSSASDPLSTQHQASTPSANEQGESILRHAFGCLLSTLKYLQDHAIRHKDIKPLNILLSDQGSIYLCDFGISLDYSETKEATTEGRVLGFTPGYCAPEVGSGEARNALSEVWSMGRVFFDMIVVLRGRSIEHARDFIGLNTERMSLLIREFLAPLQEEVDGNCDNSLVELTLSMTADKKDDRPKASDLLRAALFNEEHLFHHSYIGRCCSRCINDDIPEQLDGSSVASQPNIKSTPMINADTGSLGDESHKPIRLSTSTVARSNMSELPGDEPVPPIGHESSHTTSPEFFHHDIHGSDVRPPRLDLPRETLLEQVLIVEDRRTSNSSTSGQSQQQRSSASIDVSSSTPSPPPSVPTLLSQSPPTGCLCMARPGETGITGSQIFSTPFASSAMILLQCTTEKGAKCTSLENNVRVLESYMQGTIMTSGIWHKTRRLVISDKPSQVEVQRCNSFWLPLADIQYACRGTQVMLQWSDCNQTKEQRLGDSNLTYSRVYKPETPNNKVEIVFRDVVAAQAFIDVVTRANSGSSILWRRLGTPLTQELRLYKVQQKPSHFIVHVSVPTVPGGDIVQSKLFIQQTDSILDIWTHSLVPGERTLSVRFCGRVSTPNYSSDVNDKPSDDTATVARCSKAMLVFSEYKLDFPLISDTDGIGLPTDLREILELVTGWTICFLASGVKVTAPNAFKKTTDYGLSDVTLWESSRDAHTDAPREAIFAFRQHGPKKDYLWRTATITAQSQATYKSPDAEITIFGKSSGDLLDTSTLRTTTASALPTHSATDALASRKRPAGKQKSAREPTTLKLRFARHAEYKSFSACFDELLQTAWVDAQLQTRRRVATYLSRDSQSTDSRAGSLQQGGRGRC